MELNIFCKRRQTAEGKVFYTYLTTLTKKDGTAVSASVKFKNDCGSPKPETCPCTIRAEKQNMNLATRIITLDDGSEREAFTLWISGYTYMGKYEDHSLDDFI